MHVIYLFILLLLLFTLGFVYILICVLVSVYFRFVYTDLYACFCLLQFVYTAVCELFYLL